MKNVRQAGCVVNYNIVIAIGKGTVLANDRTLLRPWLFESSVIVPFCVITSMRDAVYYQLFLH